MTQDYGGPLFKEFEDIYFKKTPQVIVYPGNVEIAWKEFETKLYKYILNNLSFLKKVMHKSYCFVSYGCIAHAKDEIEVEFRVYALNKKGWIPCDKPYDETPNGYIDICGSEEWEEWHSFISKMKCTDKSSNFHDDIWQEKMEEQYLVCSLRALRQAIGDNTKKIYSGFYGDTAQEWVNRSNELPKNV